MVRGLDYSGMGVILGLCALVGFIEYKENEKVVKDIQSELRTVTQQNELIKKEFSEIKSYITASKITDGMRNPLKRV